MRQFDLRRIPFRPTPRVLAVGAGVAVLAGGAAIGLLPRAPAGPAPLDPAAVSALQNAAFKQAEARPGFALPESVAVTLQRGETLEAAVRRAGLGPAEAQLAVQILGKAMDTVHIK